MKKIIVLPALLVVLLGQLFHTPSALAVTNIGTGDASLLGGDLTDPEDKVGFRADCDHGYPEDQLRPPDAPWVKMQAVPVSPPHQLHAYHNWQLTPPCAIFQNHPAAHKWYLGFLDGGKGGPTAAAPYSCAVELKDAFILTHFTITTAADMPDRDPRQWAIQGSNSGKDDEWTDLYQCNAKDRSEAFFKDNTRLTTFLCTSFTSADMARAVTAADLKKVQAKLDGRKIQQADFARPKQSFKWFRVVIYSCFNPNSLTYADFNHPPGFQLGQLELFGAPGGARTAPATAVKNGATAKAGTNARGVVAGLIKPERYDPAFIISYWCGPPKSETTLARYQELADCGFNVAYAAIDNLWEPSDKAQEDHNLKVLDLCRKVGMKALLWDGNMLQVGGWDKAPKPEEVPHIGKVLDGMLARYASHPAFLGFILGDEGNTVEGNQRIGLVNQYLLKKDPTHLPYYNLLPAYAFKPLSKYDEHVSQYIETAKPALVSWDHYRQMFEGGDESTYWYNLELMRKLCVKAGLPYNQIIVSLKHMGYRECSEVDLRWQVYTSLAYGSRGIQYFTYWFCKGLAWADAPSFISQDGKRDAKWQYASKINHRIAKLGPFLTKLTSTGAYCTEPLPPGAQPLAANAPVKKAEGGPLLIGCFQSAQGTQCIMVVNRSFSDKVTAKLTLDDKLRGVAEISQDSGKPLAETLPAGGVVTVRLEPGEGRLFVLNPKTAP